MFKEKDMFEPLKDYFNRQNKDIKVYAEVGTVDVVALEPYGTTHIIEMKKSFSIKLFEQAYRGLNYANKTSILIKEPKNRHLSSGILTILTEFGIGIYFYVEQSKIVYEYRKPKVKESSMIRYNISKSLKDTHQNLTAGVKSGDGDTIYSLMIKDIQEYLINERNNDISDSSIPEENKGFRLAKDIIKNVPLVSENYSGTIESSLKSTLQQYWNVEKFEKKIINRRIHFRHKEEV